MATYDELYALTLSAGANLMNRIKIACIVSCDKISAEAAGTTNHANRIKWAKETLADPERATQMMLRAVLAKNRAATSAQITGADDATVQTAVDAAVDLLAQG